MLRRPRSCSARPTRCTATFPTGCRWSSSTSGSSSPADHRYYRGIDTSMSIDASTHSLFGVSKAAADLLVQEDGRYFEMPTVCFRGGCLTGPNHAGTRLHGVSVLSDALHDDGRAVHDLRLRG
jgi:nucleoside-diphosphate-sugar epimerase